MNIRFLLNGETVTLQGADPTRTLLDWLRTERGLTGTKEGCNEGDCGACTVMVQDEGGARAVNACILLLPQLHGKSLRTVEGISAPDGSLHPVQQAMIDHHGSQCGFCTPGFITSMATAHLNGANDYDDQLAGNLCRCTGYAPIIRAAEAAAEEPAPGWLDDSTDLQAASAAASEEVAPALPGSADELASLFAETPDATLIAGATDLALHLTKALKDLGPVIFLNRCEDLKAVETTDTEIRIGAMTDINRLRSLMQDHHPSFAEMLRRFASQQVRSAATIGGNIANGSPIGDTPPPLIALGAELHLRKGDNRRSLPLEDFFIAYGQQDITPGEFVEAITIPRQPDNLKVYKLSKRFDQDISALCAAFNITVEGGTVTRARIAFGGMAATPKRAIHVEQALIGQPWTMDTIETAQAAFAQDYAPINDMRASAAYRLRSARNLLARAFLEDTGQATSVLEVTR